MATTKTRKGTLLAKAWDVVVCRNNHPCFITTKEIRSGELVSSKAFLAIGEMKQPQEGQAIDDTRCPDCQEPVFTSADTDLVTINVRRNQDEEIKDQGS